jgi:hypothetical protein
MEPKRKLNCKENGMAIEKYTPLLAADDHCHCKCKGNFKINQLSDFKLSALHIIYITLSGPNLQKHQSQTAPINKRPRKLCFRKKQK